MRWFFLIMVFLLSLASVHAVSFSYDITAFGVDTQITEKEIVEEQCTSVENATNCINNTKKMQDIKNISWSSTKTIQIDCQYTCLYDVPEFIHPSTVEISNYSISAQDSDEYGIQFKESKQKFTSSSKDKVSVKIKIICSENSCDKNCMVCPDKSCHQPDYQCPESTQFFSLERVDPTVLKRGTNTITILLRNLRLQEVTGVSGEISGTGLKTIESTTISSIPSGERDTLVITIDAQESGKTTAVLKLKVDNVIVNFIQTFTVESDKKEEIPSAEKGNVTKVSEQFEKKKEELRTLQADYLQKKSDGYLLGDVSDTFKKAQDYADKIQLAIVDGKVSDAEKQLILFTSAIEDVKSYLQNAQKKSLGDKLKDNALLISAVVGALVAVIGLVEKLKGKVDALKDKIINRKDTKNEDKKDVTSEKKDHEKSTDKKTKNDYSEKIDKKEKADKKKEKEGDTEKKHIEKKE